MTDYAKWQKIANTLDKEESKAEPASEREVKKEKREQAEVLSKLLQFQKENFADIREPLEDNEEEKSESVNITETGNTTLV